MFHTRGAELVWLAAHHDGTPSVRECAVPATRVEDGVPMYALDKHTRLGREAIRKGREEAPFGWVIPGDQRDPGTA